VEVNWVLLQVFTSGDVERGSILERNNVSIAEVQLVVLKWSWLELHLVTLTVDAFALGVKNVTPLSFREEVIVLFTLPILVRGSLDAQLERGPKHHVLRGMCAVSSCVQRELKENWLVEGATACLILRQQEQVSVVITDQWVLFQDRLSHKVGQGDWIVEDSVVDEPVRLLWVSIAISVVSREGLEGANLMPSSTELWRAVLTHETANVSSNEGDTKYVHHHAASNWSLHVIGGGAWVTEPLSSILAGSSKGASADNEWSLGAVLLEPAVSDSNLMSTEVAVSI
jgi:hypothetical protein